MNFKEAILEMFNGKEMESAGTPWRFTEQFQYQSGNGEWHNCATIAGYKHWTHYNPELDFFQAIELLKQGRSVRRTIMFDTRYVLDQGIIKVKYSHTNTLHSCVMVPDAKYVEVK